MREASWQLPWRHPGRPRACREVVPFLCEAKPSSFPFLPVTALALQSTATVPLPLHHAPPSDQPRATFPRPRLRRSSLNPTTPPPACQTASALAAGNHDGRSRAAMPLAPVDSISSLCPTSNRLVKVQIGPRAAHRRAPATRPPPASSFRRQGPHCFFSVLSREFYAM
jgi:hypothetical protein